MYRRLVLFGLAVVAVSLMALVIPLGLAARDIVRTEEIGEAADHARLTADAWQNDWQKRGKDRISSVKVPAGEGAVTLIPPSGDPIGHPVDPRADPVIESARDGESARLDVGDQVFVSAPVPFDDATGVVLVTIDSDNLREGLAPRLFALAGVSVALLTFAAAAAWLLARRTAAPISHLAATADQMADGDLTARAAPSTIKEVHDVSIALNRLAQRVQELLADERANAAELAHQLRTPLTVLSVDIDGVSDAEVRSRLQEDVLALQRQTDEIITNARRSAREGLRPRCDAASVVAERARFWQVLAEDQHRAATVSVPTDEIWVRLTADDLATLVDILLQNVFIHTDEGTAYEVSLGSSRDDAVLVVRDYGSGFTADGMPAGSTEGTTGLGLSIAARLAEASGGSLEHHNDHGAVLVVTLGPATD
ncbi:MAG: HAMP domain-containing sensor histidine kinase [Candidatus Nanopelagicales bacterium]